MAEPELTFRIDSGKTLKFLVLLNVALAAAHLMTWAADSLLHPGLVRIFNVDVEDGIPTWFSVVQLLAASILLAVIGFGRLPSGGLRTLQWRLLSLIFLGMSLDEEIRLHESSEKILGVDFFGLDWIVPALLLTGIVAVVYFNFFLSLPRTTRALFFVAAACFIGGAAGFELLMFAVDDPASLAAILTVSVEEFLERIGISIFIFGLLRYIRDELPAGESVSESARPSIASALLLSPVEALVSGGPMRPLNGSSGALNESTRWHSRSSRNVQE